MSFYIGSVLIPNPVIIAPMAGISSNSYRDLCRKYGAGLVYTEMISDKGMFYQSPNTFKLLECSHNQHPLSVQIFGAEVEPLVFAVQYLNEHHPCDIIDFNLGCPVPKVAQRSQAGSALLQHPELVETLVTTMVKASKKPITVKIRAGWDSNSINCVQISQICEKAGVAAIAIHPRTRQQLYRGKADWSLIKLVKESVKIPVIGNGDVTSVQLAKQMMDETGCDGVMIGRATLGNPFLIQNCVRYLQTGELSNPPSLALTISALKEHGEGLIAQYGERTAIKMMRGLASHYFHHFPGVSQIRGELSQCETWTELLEIVNKLGG